MENKNILIVHNYYKISGGEDSVVKNEENMLKDYGHNVFKYSRHNDEIDNMNFFQKIKLPFESIFSFKTKREIKDIIKNKNIDVVHVHNTLPLISPSVYWGAKLGGAHIIQTVHNFRLICPGATFVKNNKICEKCKNGSLFNAIKGKCYRDSFTQTILSVFIIKINRMIGSYKKVDKYITLTEFNKEKLCSIIDKSKIAVKPNFVKNSTNSFEVSEKKYFLYVGRIDTLKGIHVLVKAWEKISDEILVIIGDGPELEKLKKYIKAKEINNIQLIGKKQNDEVQLYMKKAKMLIVPSLWYEGFPMTIVESFSNSLPVIASDLGNLSSIIEENYNGLLFEKGNPDDLRNKIKSVIRDEKVIEKYSVNSYITFIEKYSQQVNYKILKKIYNI